MKLDVSAVATGSVGSAPGCLDAHSAFTANGEIAAGFEPEPAAASIERLAARAESSRNRRIARCRHLEPPSVPESAVQADATGDEHVATGLDGEVAARGVRATPRANARRERDVACCCVQGDVTTVAFRSFPGQVYFARHADRIGGFEHDTSREVGGCAYCAVHRDRRAAAGR